jgi:tRNA A-37 threonylcarbamoyl transferase component Bud32
MASFKLIGDPDVLTAVRASCLFDGPDLHEADHRWDILNDTPESIVYRVSPRHKDLPPVVVVKKYRWRFPRILRTIGVKPRAVREYENLKALQERGVPVPTPIACGVNGVFGFVREAILITQKLEGARNLREKFHAIREGHEPLPPRACRETLIRQLAEILKKLHAEKFFLHTLFDKNLLLDGECGTLYLIDVPFARILIQKLRPGTARIRDLATLNKSARRTLPKTDLLRFLRIYLGRDKLTPSDKRLIRDVNHFTDKLEDKTFGANLVRVAKGRKSKNVRS